MMSLLGNGEMGGGGGGGGGGQKVGVKILFLETYIGDIY